MRGNVVMEGYYNDPDATAAAIRGGWFHSGDAAVVHPDGYVEIRDRFKDVIISGGENISSVEVEGELLRHPAVLEVAIVGVPDEKWGEAPHGFIVLKPRASATEDELREFARARLAHFKVPRGVHVRPRAAEDRDRENSEVRAARRPGCDLGAVGFRPGRSMRTSRGLAIEAQRLFLRLGRIEAGEQGWQGTAWAIERIYPHRFARPEVMNQIAVVQAG